MAKPRYLVLLGAPGAGKGTQAAYLSHETGLPRVASGDLFRAALGKGTELGLLARGYTERGELVPDEVTVRMVMERLEGEDCREGAILDGFPRTLAQAEALERALSERGHSLEKAVYIRVEPETLVQRLGGRWICRSCEAPYHASSNPTARPGVCDRCGGELYQRDDDKEETTRRRLDVYFEQTAPLVGHYRRQGLLVEVDGGGGIEKVRAALAAALRDSLK